MLSKSPVERYQALLAAARYFGRAMDLTSLIDEILHRAEEVMHAEACSFLLPDAKTGDLILHSTDPWIAKLPEPLRVPPGAGIAGAVFQSKQPINVKDARTDPRHYSNVGSGLGMGPLLKEFIASVKEMLNLNSVRAIGRSVRRILICRGNLTLRKMQYQ